MVKVKLQFQFFDTKLVERLLDAGTRKALSKAGAFVRRTAKGLIRKKKGISAPGKPPANHTGRLRELIFFGLDISNRSVAVGPLRFRDGKAPKLLEFGGTTTVNRKPATYRPRPFMGPALEKERPKLPALWAGAVKK